MQPGDKLVRLSESRSLEIPREQREAAGLAPGDLVVASVVDGELRLRSARAIMAGLQCDAADLFAGSDVTVDSFIAGRRANFD
jgi:bifunctional DNA-binding transcriptional regulator/antitoxin component of YhaV-PrlF toxin-antitoxin module